MIIDVHCHILPDVDDGALDGKTTKKMLRQSVEEEIDAIVATPHFSCGMQEDEVRAIKKKYLAVRRWWNENEPEKKLYLGGELYYSEGLIEALDQKIAMTMNGTRYVLVEFPIYLNFQNIQKAIQKLLYAGYIPIIAHVERYERIRDCDKIAELVEMGAYIQVNASTLLGNEGLRIKFYVSKLMKKGLVHFVGTDAHDAEDRAPRMKQCVKYLEKKLGKMKASQILEENPMKMLRGEELNG